MRSRAVSVRVTKSEICGRPQNKGALNRGSGKFLRVCPVADFWEEQFPYVWYLGYVGTQQAAPICWRVCRLEYRGYDSAGVCVEQNGVLKVEKAKGRLQNLIAKTENGALLPGTLGIGHTRWATHGEPNDTNSHPHVSQNGKIAVVHNGIIENYLELREFLQQKGVQFASQTDTEVVAQLMEYCMGLPEVETVSDALYMVLHRIEARMRCHPLLGRSRPRLCRAQGRAAAHRLRRGRELHRLRRDGACQVHARRCVWTTARSPFWAATACRSITRWSCPSKRSTITSTGRSPPRKRAATSISCSRRSWRSRRPCAGQSCPASKTARSSSTD